MFEFPEVGVGDIVLFSEGPNSSAGAAQWLPLIVTKVHAQVDVDDDGAEHPRPYAVGGALIVQMEKSGVQKRGIHVAYPHDSPLVTEKPHTWEAISTDTRQGIFKVGPAYARLKALERRLGGQSPPRPKKKEPELQTA